MGAGLLQHGHLEYHTLWLECPYHTHLLSISFQVLPRGPTSSSEYSLPGREPSGQSGSLANQMAAYSPFGESKPSASSSTSALPSVSVDSIRQSLQQSLREAREQRDQDDQELGKVKTDIAVTQDRQHELQTELERINGKVMPRLSGL